jgi:hypothetical protein
VAQLAVDSAVKTALFISAVFTHQSKGALPMRKAWAICAILIASAGCGQQETHRIGEHFWITDTHGNGVEMIQTENGPMSVADKAALDYANAAKELPGFRDHAPKSGK